MDETRGGQGGGDGGDDDLVEARRTMVIEQLVHRGIRDPRVLGAMGLVPRHRFVDERLTATGLRRPSPVDRVRPDHLAALHGGTRHRAGGGSSRPIARWRWGQAPAIRRPSSRSWRRRCSPSRSSRRWRSGPAGVERDRAQQCHAGAVRRQRRLAGARALRRHHRLGRRAAVPGRCWRRSWPRVAAWSSRSAALKSRRSRSSARRGDHFRFPTTRRCRYVDLLGRFGVGRGAAGLVPVSAAAVAAAGRSPAQALLCGMRHRPPDAPRNPPGHGMWSRQARPGPIARRGDAARGSAGDQWLRERGLEAGRLLFVLRAPEAATPGTTAGAAAATDLRTGARAPLAAGAICAGLRRVAVRHALGKDA